MESIEQAVAYALNPTADPGLKQQAGLYCEQVKASPDGWQVCLQLFVRDPKSTPEARFFALQVIEEAVDKRFTSLDPSAVGYLQQGLMTYVKREYADIPNNPNLDIPYIRNKLAHAIVLLFLNTYPETWASFFDDFLNTLASNPTNGGSPSSSTNIQAVDFFLRLNLSLDEEIARQDVPRGREQTLRNTQIKDAMRDGDIRKLANAWFELLQEYKDRDQSIADMCLKVIGVFISWMDIGLVVNDPFMRLIFDLLRGTVLRNGACECLVESGDEEFVERVAKLVNELGIQLCDIWTGNGVPKEMKDAAYVEIEKAIPYLLRFLADEYDDTASAVFPFAGALLNEVKRQNKGAGQGMLGEPQRKWLMSMLEVCIQKMKYDEEYDWVNGEDGAEEEAAFLDIRKNLRGFVDAIAAIDEQMFIGYATKLVGSSLEQYTREGDNMDWRTLELALYVMYYYGETSKKQLQYVISISAGQKLTPMGEMMSTMVSTAPYSHPHPSIPLQYFENVVRYYQFFEPKSEHIGQVLEAFVGQRGLHNPLKHVRMRSWYLFHRFVKSLKPKMGPYVEIVVSTINDLLVIQAELPPVLPDGASIDPAATATTFDSQIYLFEAVGMLISIDTIAPQTQAKYLEAILNPLMSGIQEYMGKEMYQPEEPLFPIQLHHYMSAIGSVAKGFPEQNKNTQNTQPWAPLFRQCAETIVMVLQAINRFEVIREGARFSFSRLINCLGQDMLPYLPPVISALLTECQISELSEFLPFVSQIAHKFKPHIATVLSNLLQPLIEKVFSFLKQTPSGTDEAVLLQELKQAYLLFLISLFQSDIESVYLTEQNLSFLPVIMQSVIHYASDTSAPTVEKMAFGLLLRMVNAWGVKAPKVNGTVDATPTASPVPGFESFMYEHVLRICFEVPLKAEFNLSDAQTVLCVTEIAGIQKAMYEQQPDGFVTYMRAQFLPAIQCPPELAEEYLQAIQTLDNRMFKRFFQELDMRRSSQQDDRPFERPTTLRMQSDTQVKDAAEFSRPQYLHRHGTAPTGTSSSRLPRRALHDISNTQAHRLVQYSHDLEFDNEHAPAFPLRTEGLAASLFLTTSPRSFQSSPTSHTSRHRRRSSSSGSSTHSPSPGSKKLGLATNLSTLETQRILQEADELAERYGSRMNSAPTSLHSDDDGECSSIDTDLSPSEHAHHMLESLTSNSLGASITSDFEILGDSERQSSAALSSSPHPTSPISPVTFSPSIGKFDKPDDPSPNDHMLSSGFLSNVGDYANPQARHLEQPSSEPLLAQSTDDCESLTLPAAFRVMMLGQPMGTEKHLIRNKISRALFESLRPLQGSEPGELEHSSKIISSAQPEFSPVPNPRTSSSTSSGKSLATTFVMRPAFQGRRSLSTTESAEFVSRSTMFPSSSTLDTSKPHTTSTSSFVNLSALPAEPFKEKKYQILMLNLFSSSIRPHSPVETSEDHGLCLIEADFTWSGQIDLQLAELYLKERLQLNFKPKPNAFSVYDDTTPRASIVAHRSGANHIVKSLSNMLSRDLDVLWDMLCGKTPETTNQTTMLPSFPGTILSDESPNAVDVAIYVYQCPEGDLYEDQEVQDRLEQDMLFLWRLSTFEIPIMILVTGCADAGDSSRLSQYHSHQTLLDLLTQYHVPIDQCMIFSAFKDIPNTALHDRLTLLRHHAETVAQKRADVALAHQVQVAQREREQRRQRAWRRRMVMGLLWCLIGWHVIQFLGWGMHHVSKHATGRLQPTAISLVGGVSTASKAPSSTQDAAAFDAWSGRHIHRRPPFAPPNSSSSTVSSSTASVQASETSRTSSVSTTTAKMPLPSPTSSYPLHAKSTITSTLIQPRFPPSFMQRLRQEARRTVREGTGNLTEHTQYLQSRIILAVNIIVTRTIEAIQRIQEWLFMVWEGGWWGGVDPRRRALIE
ncbi:hypothetical protein BZG36_02232 [Bifiguratus adelaidae]|uniref:Exportin-T n=1 Tax=Bifiguratus adelaidae TaxID=1938954 RepID=A0A261Y3G0_9FUNG|nr:hypothetical protein BZG36_02232 [Bifiguratus adelaidae]